MIRTYGSFDVIVGPFGVEEDEDSGGVFPRAVLGQAVDRRETGQIQLIRVFVLQKTFINDVPFSF